MKPWVSSSFTTGPVSPWAGPQLIEIDISAANPATALPQGILYAIGSENFTTAWANPTGGQVEITGTALASGAFSQLTNRATSRIFTGSVQGANFIWDFDAQGTGRRVRADHLFIQHGWDSALPRLQQFVVEVGNGSDAASATWAIATTVSDPNFLPNAIYSWSARLDLTPPVERARFLRIRMTGPNTWTASSYELSISEMELGGIIFPGSLGY